MKFLILAILLPVMWFCLFNNSRIDGTYKVIYDKKYTNLKNVKYTITFKDSVYLKKQYGKPIEKGEISSSDSKDRHIIYLIDGNQSHPFTPLDSLLDKSFGKPIMELKIKNLDTIEFRTTHLYNLHVTLNKGMMLRIK